MFAALLRQFSSPAATFKSDSLADNKTPKTIKGIYMIRVDYETSQHWAVNLKPHSYDSFLNLGATDKLFRWTYYVDVPEEKGRTETQLLDKIYSLTPQEIQSKCQKEGIAIDLKDLKQFANFESLNCRFKRLNVGT
ncbi:MAG: hypothetical protein CMG77_07675 [Marinimicrobium sp.]|jgi:hypothetical protein|nr:hypothetical protein [Marinimicrobium sp.]|tara:strand:+ start:211 stop:618 length:408 start_codon:yes stop_codon:yes gene_type:complete